MSSYNSECYVALRSFTVILNKYLYIFQVYYYLLKVYLQPPEPTVLGLTAFKDGIKPKPNIPAALKIMEEHAGCLDTTRVCL